MWPFAISKATKNLILVEIETINTGLLLLFLSMMMMIFEYSRLWLRLTVTSVSATEVFQRNKKRNAQRTTTDTEVWRKCFRETKRGALTNNNWHRRTKELFQRNTNKQKRYLHHSYEYTQKQWQQIILTGSFQKNAIAVTLCVVRLLVERNVLAWTK